MPSDISERLPARLCFTITTGRSGTEYLARVLDLFRGVHAEHEPKPTFSSAFRTVCSAPWTAREFWLEHKLPRIARTREPFYVETSHLACKGFLESAIELGLRPTLVHLVRDPRAVASSLFALNTIPGRTFKGIKYYLAPSDRVFLPLPGDLERVTDYQLCYWYCLEVEERARVYRDRFEPLGVEIVRVELAELATAEGVLALGMRLGLGAPSARGKLWLAHKAGRPTNKKVDKQRPMPFSAGELAAQEGELRRWLGHPELQSASSL